MIIVLKSGASDAEIGSICRRIEEMGQARIAVTALVPETASLEELFLGMTEGEQPGAEEAVA